MDKTHRYDNKATSTAGAKVALLVYFAALIAVSAVPFVADQAYEPMQASSSSSSMAAARDDAAPVLQVAVRDPAVAWAAATVSATRDDSPIAKF